MAKVTRAAIQQQIDALDPDKDYQKIIQNLGNYLYSFDFERSLEFALFRTYGIPSISKILVASGEFNNRPRKRYDDTELLLAYPIDYGIDSDEGKRSIKRINAMHAMYDISNDDFLYVLSTFVLEPSRWMEMYGERSIKDAEKKATYNYYKVLGTRLKIKDIPESFEAFDKFNRDYEEKHMVYDDANPIIGNATVDLLLGMYMSKFMFPIGRIFVYAMMDERLRASFNYPKTPRWLYSVIKAALRLRAKCAILIPLRYKEFSKVNRPTYPEGCRIEEIGTFQCPFEHKTES